MHGPTYYVLMVPFYWIGQPLGTNGSLYAIRLATVGLVLCAIPLTWLLARRLLRLFVELNRLGTSVVIATHDLTLMDQYDARRLVLNGGHVELYD